MTRFTISRRTFVGGAAGAAGLTAFGARAQAQLAMPSAPVALNVIDVAGNLALTQKAIENYRKEKPKAVSRITFTKAPAPATNRTTVVMIVSLACNVQRRTCQR